MINKISSIYIQIINIFINNNDSNIPIFYQQSDHQDKSNAITQQQFITRKRTFKFSKVIAAETTNINVFNWLSTQYVLK